MREGVRDYRERMVYTVIDAMQIEVGRAIRTDSALIAALSDGIAAFYTTYLQPTP